MLPCHDNYATTFESFPQMLRYHESMAKESTWQRCKVKELYIEPLDPGSPFSTNLSAFASGISEEAVQTVENSEE